MYWLMPGTFWVNELMIKSKSIMKLEGLQQKKDMIKQQDAC